MKYVERFEGSCGHTVDSDITEDEFKELCKPFTAKTFLGEGEYQNPILKEEGLQIVVIIPFRYCVCINCMSEILEDMKHGD